jgi:hypothetical protein
MPRADDRDAFIGAEQCRSGPPRGACSAFITPVHAQFCRSSRKTGSDLVFGQAEIQAQPLTSLNRAASRTHRIAHCVVRTVGVTV